MLHGTTHRVLWFFSFKGKSLSSLQHLSAAITAPSVPRSVIPSGSFQFRKPYPRSRGKTPSVDPAKAAAPPMGSPFTGRRLTASMPLEGLWIR